jgi:hypothetical protein
MAVILRLRPSRLSWRVIDDSLVVLDLERSEYFTVNTTGIVLWNLLEVGATLEELTGALTEQFEIDAASAAEEVAAFVDMLRDLAMLQ